MPRPAIITPAARLKRSGILARSSQKEAGKRNRFAAQTSPSDGPRGERPDEPRPYRVHPPTIWVLNGKALTSVSVLLKISPGLASSSVAAAALISISD
jgi:hypothetical protein